jgi:hypothetical protein
VLLLSLGADDAAAVAAVRSPCTLPV